MTTTAFARGSTKIGKAHRGRTVAEATPVAIRSRVELRPGFERRIRAELGAKLGHAGPLIERGTVRFEDVNGPKGGIDVVCRIKLVMSGRPSVHVAETAADPEAAFAAAVPVVVRALERVRDKHGLRAGRRRGRTPPPEELPIAEAVDEAIDAGEIIGRRLGRGPAALARALERPEKLRRDAYVDTARPGVSASHRRAGGPISARRNTKAKTTRATATLEDSRTRPSRKSTRRSANRGKPSQTKERTAVARSVTPSARAGRARAASRASR